MRKSMLSLVFVVCALILIDGEKAAATIYCDKLWGPDGAQLSQYQGDLYLRPGVVRVLSDGSGGAFYAMQISTVDGYRQVYVQRIDENGLSQWGDHGVRVYSGVTDSSNPVISLVGDNSGGVIVAWHEQGHMPGYYMQRLDANGVEQWTSGGVLVPLLSMTFDVDPHVTTDGANGAILIYKESEVYYDPYGPTITFTRIRMQRVDEHGALQWGDYSKIVSTSPDNTSHRSYGIASDGAEGAITAYAVPYSELNGRAYIRVVRWDSNGDFVWGHSIDQPTTVDSRNVKIMEDGSGGAIVSWVRYEGESDTLRAQRLSADGTVLWTIGGVEIAAESVDPSSVRIASDGSGGALIIWADDRSGSFDIYAQRLDENGTCKWASGGIAVCGASGDQIDPGITISGDKGAVISWVDGRATATDIYAQLLDSLGVGQWASDGIPICSEQYDQTDPVITGDEADGAIVAWLDFRLMETTYHEIYSQRIDPSGSELWSSGGELLCPFRDKRQENVVCASDGSEGVISVWNEAMGGICAQRVGSTGLVQWGNYGIAVCPASWKAENPHIVSNGSGGAIVAWQDSRSGEADIYAQQVDDNGSEIWSLDDITICTVSGEQLYPRIAEDGAGGAIICWQDDRAGDFDVYAQRINSSGSVLWSVDGVGLCTAIGDQEQIQIIPDGSGGAILVWADKRNSEYDIYAQRVDADGAELWSAGGLAVCTETGDQTDPQLTSDGAGGAIITWRDRREYEPSCYVQRISFDGTAQWDPNGIFISKEEEFDGRFSGVRPEIVADGDGGAIVTWSEWHDVDLGGYVHNRFFYHHVQRIAHDGSFVWAPGSIRISDESETACHGIVSDGAGGAIVVWEDEGIMAQYVDSTGSPLWEVYGEIVADSNPYEEMVTAYDGAGGCLISWVDYETRISFGQRIRHKTGSYSHSIIFVDQGATGVGDGTSWENAFTDIQAALDTAYEHYKEVDEIWVADGIYTPTNGTDRDESIHIMGHLGDSLKIYGGFAGSEMTLEERNWQANVTTLSGDIGLSGDNTDNSYQVVTVSGTDSLTMLDGFVIREGYGDEPGAGLFAEGAMPIQNCRLEENISSVSGGGIFSGSEELVSISNVTFVDNSAVNGGGLYCSGSADLKDLSFLGNSADSLGGGLYCAGYELTIENLSCTSNTAMYGGGMAVVAEEADTSDIDLTSGVFIGNAVSGYGGGLYLRSGNGNFTATGIEFLQNSAERGGGVCVYQDWSISSELNPHFYNCMFHENSASVIGAGMYVWDDETWIVNTSFSKNSGPNTLYLNEFYLINSIVWGDDVPANSSIEGYDGIVTYSLVQGCWIGDGGEPQWNEYYGTDGGNNLDQDPFFADAEGGDLRLFVGSPAIDAGDSTVAGLPALDILGNPRILGETIDMGAYEGGVSALQMTITTEPEGFEIVVAGETFESPYIFASAIGAEVEISTVSPQRDKGTDYYFLAWSDGGDTTHVVTMPDTNATYTAIFTDDITGDEVEPVPLVNALHQNHPNPFNPSTTISFSLKSRGHANLAVYDVAGRLVRVLIDGVMEAGPRDVTWDGRDNAGRGVASGVYFYRLEAGEFIETRKMVLLR